jgi:hypothetical protein
MLLNKNKEVLLLDITDGGLEVQIEKTRTLICLCPVTRMHGKISLVIANKSFENAVQIF